MQRRLFTQHTHRVLHPLSGSWKFYFPDQGLEIDPFAILPESAGEMLCVPSVWESLPARANYRGQALAVRQVEVLRSGPVRFVFEGVSHTCRVFLDGKEIGAHHNAYTPFACDVAHVEAGGHELRLWISNEHGALSALHVPNDYYNYGGISRPAEIQELGGPVFIENLRVTPRHEDGQWQADVQVDLKQLGADAFAGGTLRLRLAGQAQSMEIPSPNTSTHSLTMHFTCPGVSAWTPTRPDLYSAEAELMDAAGHLVDDMRERFGFRTIEVRGRDLVFNGKPLRIAGVNRHEDHPDFGCAIPVELMQRDLALIKDMGANLVRTSHYSNDQRFLDLCDEQGILVWEESHARGLTVEQTAHPLYVEQTRTNTREMVLAHHSHPSIILWGYLNECESWTEVGCEAYRVAEETTKALDTSRPTTYAACHWENDQCQEIPEVLGWNLYPLWYGEKSPEVLLADLEKLLGDKGVNGKPLIISEFGAGAFFGFRDAFRKARWSEELQEEILDSTLNTFLNHPRVAGSIIWQFCDVRVDPSWASQRPRAYNEKGMVDEYRRPKLAYRVARRHFHDFLEGYSYGEGNQPAMTTAPR